MTVGFGRVLAIASRLGVVIALLFIWPANANAADPLTPDDIVALGQLGFTEDEIRTELEPFEGTYEIGEEGLQALEAAGFSGEFLRFVESLRPERRIDNAALAGMLAEGATAVDMLRAIAGAEADLDTSPRAILELRQAGDLPLSVVMAMRGAALTPGHLEALAEGPLSSEELRLLIEVVDVAPGRLAPELAVALFRRGIDGEVIAAIRARAAEDRPREVAAREEEPQQVPHQEPAADLEFTAFDHVMDLFSLRYPSGWRLVRQIEAEDILYVVTPESGVTDIAAMRTGAALTASALGEATEVEPEEIVSKAIRGLQIYEPAPVFDEGFHEATIAGQPGVYRSYNVEMEGDDEPVRGRLYVTTSGAYAYALIVQAPQSAFDARLPVFERMAAELQVGAESWATRESGERHTTDGLTQRFEEAVVQVKGTDGRSFAAGTGFLVREDGYLLTNAHVILKPGTEQYWDEITVHWPERFGREPAKADIVDAYYVRSELGQRTVGGALAWEADIALLKISTAETLPTVPITRQRDVRLGDTVFVIGYPRPGDFDDQVSTTVTGGVITRYLHGDDRQVQMIITDAKIAGGNSGGPVISVRTGGVVGLATTALSQEVIQRLEQTNGAPDRASQLIGYNGVLPIAKALRLFPQVITVSADRDRRIDYLDAYDLALRSAEHGWIEGALRSAEEAVELGRRRADAYSLLGRLKSEIGANAAMLSEGRRALDTALEIDPEHLPTLLFQVRHDLDNRDYLEAMRRANRAVSVAPSEWQTHYERARVNRVLERYDEALADLAEAQRLSADLFPEPYNLAGAIHYDKKEYDAGKASYEKAVEIAPTDVDARLGVGHYYLKAGNAFSALVEFDELNAEVPKQPKVLHGMGDAYLQLADYRKAMDNYAEALVLFYEHRQKPPEELLIDAARIAVRNLREESSGVMLYAHHLNNYYESERTLASHQFLADVMKGDNPGVARLHLTRAVELLRVEVDEGEASERAERLKKQLEEVRTANLTAEDIERMRKANYPDLLSARLVVMEEIPLALQLRGSTGAEDEHDAERIKHLQELAQQFGPTITAAIEIKARAQEAAQAQRQEAPQNGRQARPEQGNGQQANAAGRGADDNRGYAELPGIWLHQGRSGQIELELSRDRTYTISVIRDGQRQPFDRGQWRIGEDRASLILAGPQQGGETQYRTQIVDPNTIVLVSGGNQWRYRKQ